MHRTSTSTGCNRIGLQPVFCAWLDYARPRPLVPLRNVNLNFHAYLSGNGQNDEINLLIHVYLSDFPLNSQINMNVQL
jgi:hypothetical protein